MVTVADKARRIEESRRKIQEPCEVDPTLCLYSPQDNVDSLSHPRVKRFMDHVTEVWRPDLPKADRRILLLLPCTKTKPYPFSSEHKRINQRLLAEGFAPIGRAPLPQQLLARLEPEYPQGVLDLSVLSDGHGTIIHRAVISEPLAVVPYEMIMRFGDEVSPAVAYDDPGLFENRGNAVSPWRADSTAVQVSDTRWKWGDNEKRAYVTMHNVMAEAVAKTIARLGDVYTDRISWVAPGLTHRSFVLGHDERAAHGVVASRQVAGERLRLQGANDFLPPALKITCLPTTDQCQDAIRRLARRLGTTPNRVGGVYSRGGADATPLALPELLDVLVAAIRAPRPRG